MIRLSLLQLRAQAITAAVAVTAFAVVLTVTGPHLASNFLQNAEGSYGVVYLLSIAIIMLTPAVIGLFWGAPLIARELETGTFDLAWSQSVTRTRWLAVKLAVGGIAAMALTQALSLMFAWWAAPLSRAAGQGGGTNGVARNQFDSLAVRP